MSSHRSRISVVGAGIIGLTCGVRLAEAGYAVDVLARDLPLETTSAIAGGLWLPFEAAPARDVARWARTSYATFRQDATDERTGVRMVPGRLLHPLRALEPSWAAGLRDVAPLLPVDGPAPGYAFAWRMTAPLVHTPTYLRHLIDRLRLGGGTLTRLALPALPGQGLVVNCTGLAARALADDPQVRPGRGHVLLLSDPGLTEWFVDEGTPAHDRGHPARPLTYVLPRGRDVVVGGTNEDGNYSTTPVPAQGAQILARARALVPALADAAVLGQRVGLRPLRPGVRLEVEQRSGEDGRDQHIVHCYGHGGAGWTLAWGCADDVLARVSDLAA